MNQKAIAIYCFLDDFLQAVRWKEDKRTRLTDAQVLTVGLLAALYFYGNQASALRYLVDHHGFYPLEKSQFNRRLHRLSPQLMVIFRAVATSLKYLNTESRYLLDSFPVAVCHNIRIARCRLLEEEAYRGYCSSKKSYFYGFRVQMMTTEAGLPVDFYLYAGAFVDVTDWQTMPVDLPAGSELYADSGYTDYQVEDLLQECDQIHLRTVRKKNSQRSDPAWLAYLKHHFRKRIETVFSQIKAHFPAHIHAVTAEGFILKITLFIIALTLDYLTT
ncbi:MAG: IS982 family transposase [Cyclobacteriaceae bacterium]